jgi:hypothetical protein
MASVAASVQGDLAAAVMARTRGCHVCFMRDYFLIDCPFLPPEVRQAITTQRTQQIQQDRGVLPSMINPPSPSPSATPFTSGVAPRPAPQFPRSRTYPPQPVSDPALFQLGTLVPSHRDGEPRPTDGPTPGGDYQCGHVGGGKRFGRRLETGVTCYQGTYY